MRVVAVSVGTSRTLEINGQPVRTAFLKRPVSGRVRFTEAGPEGNETAVHTDAVYAYGHESYAYWAAELGVDGAAWPPGYFAENLTIEGLDERSLRVGDRLRVGPDVELIVAGPRVPCFKLAWRMQQPESFIPRFALSGRTGVYFSVARPGSVGAGDAIVPLERSAHATVAEVSEMIFGNAEVAADTLRSLLALPCLSQTVALGLRNRLYRILDVEETRKGRWNGWRSFRVEQTVDEAPGIRSFQLRPVDGAPLSRFRAGQFLTLRLPVSRDGAPLQRTWSLSDYSEHPSTYRLTIKREAQGIGSRWMHEEVREGTIVEARAPAGRFVLDRGGFKPVILIGAGIGITPLLAMAKSHLARGREAPLLHFIHCVRDGAHQPFRAELDALSREPTVRVIHVFSSPREVDRHGCDYAIRGRLTLATLAPLVGDAHIIHGGKRIDLPWYDCDIYLCGPKSFQDSLLGEMSAQGIDPKRINTESFQPPQAQSATPGVTHAQVILQRSRRTLTWRPTDDRTLLELLESEGLRPESGCRLGICHSCRCRLIDGSIEHDVAPFGLAPDEVLLCRARPVSSVVTLDF